MANVLNTDKQMAIIAALSEGSSIRSIERITGVLHVPPAVSPITAVRAAIMQELREMRANADIETEAS
jgi:hypothetical protein